MATNSRRRVVTDVDLQRGAGAQLDAVSHDRYLAADGCVLGGVAQQVQQVQQDQQDLPQPLGIGHDVALNVDQIDADSERARFDRPFEHVQHFAHQGLEVDRPEFQLAAAFAVRGSCATGTATWPRWPARRHRAQCVPPPQSAVTECSPAQALPLH